MTRFSSRRTTASGRARGGLTTKIHALVDGGARPVTVLLSAGQAGDNPRLVPLLDGLRQTGHRPAHLLADKAYSHPSTRRELRRRRVSHTIAERRDQVERRTAQGSAGGRPPKFDPEIYAAQHRRARRLSRWSAAAASGGNRRAIPAHCTLHGGTPGFTNLVVSKLDGGIQLDPHVDGSRLITPEEDSARVLVDVLREWLK